MMSKRKSFRIFSKMFIVVLILMLSCMGISYAYWNKNLKVDANLSTASMDVGFQNTYKVNKNPEDFYNVASQHISFQNDSNIGVCKTNNVMVINVVMKKSAEINITYYTKNSGTMPIKPMNDRNLVVRRPDGSLVDQIGLEVSVMCSPSLNLLKAQGEDQGTIRIKTKPEHNPKIGVYEFSLIIPYKQCENEKKFIVDPEGGTISDGKWRENLSIRGTVEVVE